ncbi:uncharacterized protein LOC110860784 [Folsomia candida]|uniref:Uncharacterized protein n=1 Tax=Folsomia candida TaxID=158441 RepID=A0A226D4N6_FOLCA|nr:uncharacterized protein LOC110860784 [Folsomia candida]OXA40199.1 hypothetical protein Fcan01_25057 [Folsomia candida]
MNTIEYCKAVWKFFVDIFYIINLIVPALFLIGYNFLLAYYLRACENWEECVTKWVPLIILLVQFISSIILVLIKWFSKQLVNLCREGTSPKSIQEIGYPCIICGLTVISISGVPLILLHA